MLTSPEQLQGVKLQNALDLLKKQGRLINCFVDEAHCVDLWSGSFRSAYSKLGFLKNKIGIPVTALSGSATDQTVSAIQKSLSMSENTLITRMSFSRENLSISILKKSTKPYYQIANLVKNDYPDSCGIVYCNKRITTKELAHELRCQGISATFIHGGLNDTERRSSEKKWKEEIVKVACCTKTFGMGIDKRNVRFVFHVDMPESYEDYYQEIGRAGRDQEPAVAMSLLSPGDRNFHLQNISRISDKDEREFKLKNLYHISKMFLQTSICRHSLIMKHFGETIPPCEERCDICCGIQKNTELDCIKEARVVMKCMTDMKRISSKVTMNLLLLTLMGSNAQEVKIKGFDAVEHHGAAKKFYVGTCKKKDRKLFLHKIVLELIFQQFISETFKEKEVRGRKIQETNCQECIVYLELGNLAEFYLLKKLIVP